MPLACSTFSFLFFLLENPANLLAATSSISSFHFNNAIALSLARALSLSLLHGPCAVEDLVSLTAHPSVSFRSLVNGAARKRMSHSSLFVAVFSSDYIPM